MENKDEKELAGTKKNEKIPNEAKLRKSKEKKLDSSKTSERKKGKKATPDKRSQEDNQEVTQRQRAKSESVSDSDQKITELNTRNDLELNEPLNPTKHQNSISSLSIGNDSKQSPRFTQEKSPRFTQEKSPRFMQENEETNDTNVPPLVNRGKTKVSFANTSNFYADKSSTMIEAKKKGRAGRRAFVIDLDGSLPHALNAGSLDVKMVDTENSFISPRMPGGTDSLGKRAYQKRKSYSHVVVTNKTHYKIGKYRNVHITNICMHGRVFVGQADDTDSFPVSIKEVDMSSFPYAYLQPSLNFFEKISQVSFLNIVSYYEAFLESDAFYIVYELSPCGTLADCLKLFGSFSEEQIAQIIYQLLSANEQSHELGPALSYEPENILIFEDGTIKTQFDIPTAFSTVGISPFQTNVTLKRMNHSKAPESYSTLKSTSMGTSWAIGVLALCLLTGEHPYEGSHLHGLYEMSKKGPQIPKNISNNLASFLSECFRENPRERITVKEMKIHPWLLKTASHNAAKRLRQLLPLSRIQIYDINAPASGIGLVRLYNTPLMMSNDMLAAEVKDSVITLNGVRKHFEKFQSILVKDANNNDNALAESNPTKRNEDQNVKSDKEASDFDFDSESDSESGSKQPLHEELEDNFSEMSVTMIKSASGVIHAIAELIDSSEQVFALGALRSDKVVISKLCVVTKNENEIDEEKPKNSSETNPFESSLPSVKEGQIINKESTPEKKSNKEKLSPAEAAEMKEIDTLLSGLRTLTQYFVTKEETLKLASIVFGKAVDSLSFSYQGPISLLTSSRQQTTNKWRDVYACLKDNFLFISKNARSQPTEALYFSTLNVTECDALFFKREFCFSVHNQVFSVNDKKNYREWLEAFRSTKCWYNVVVDDVSKATLLAYSSKHPKKGSLFSTNSDAKGVLPVFGFSLDDIAKRESKEIPSIVENLTNHIITYGLKEEGIFRIPGSLEEMQLLQERFDTADSPPDLTKFDIHSVCGAFKSFFRSLPNPIFNSELDSKVKPILTKSRQNQSLLQQGLQQISALLKMHLSDTSFKSLKCVFRLFSTIVANEKTTKMNVENLLTCVNPSLKCPNDLFRILTTNYNTVFDE